MFFCSVFENYFATKVFTYLICMKVILMLLCAVYRRFARFNSSIVCSIGIFYSIGLYQPIISLPLYLVSLYLSLSLSGPEAPDHVVPGGQRHQVGGQERLHRPPQPPESRPRAERHLYHTGTECPLYCDNFSVWKVETCRSTLKCSVQLFESDHIYADPDPNYLNLSGLSLGTFCRRMCLSREGLSLASLSVTFHLCFSKQNY